MYRRGNPCSSQPHTTCSSSSRCCSADSHSGGGDDADGVDAEYFEGFATEAKHVYDVFLNRNNEVCGISVKSKCLGKNEKIESLDKVGRVYMELTNSPALLWSPIKEIGITENQFGQEHLAQTIGDSILDTVESWYDEAEISAEIFTYLNKKP